MKISGWNKTTLLDGYSRKVFTEIFTNKCNYRCPACHAKNLFENERDINKELFFDYIDTNKDFFDGVVICGGEPTLELGLEDFIRRIKEKGLAVKLDTNGSNFEILENLLKKELIDYVAMDVKGPRNLYPNLVGRDFIDLRDNVEKGMNLVSMFPDYEYRTTVVPVVREDEISFMTVAEAVDTAKFIVETTNINDHKYFLQKFVPQEGGLLDFRLEKFPETPKGLLLEMKEAVKKYLPLVKIRGE